MRRSRNPKEERRVKNQVWCPASNQSKLQYPTESAAEKSLEYLDKDEFKDSNRIPIRAYYCEACICWHTTSRASYGPKPNNKLESLLGEEINESPVIRKHTHSADCWKSPDSKCFYDIDSLILHWLAKGFTKNEIIARLGLPMEIAAEQIQMAIKGTRPPKPQAKQHRHSSECWVKGSHCFRDAQPLVANLSRKGKSFNEIAEMIGTTTGNVKSIYDSFHHKRRAEKKNLTMEKSSE